MKSKFYIIIVLLSLIGLSIISCGGGGGTSSIVGDPCAGGHNWDEWSATTPIWDMKETRACTICPETDTRDLMVQITPNNGLSPFKISMFEVTQELWLSVMGSNPSYFHGGSGREPASGENQARRPVEFVSWNEANAFITALNVLSGENYRLPSEEEWEYAARAGYGTIGAFGEYSYGQEEVVVTHSNLNQYAWYWDSIPTNKTGQAGYGTQQVGGKLPNAWGLHDMHGNVAEWTSTVSGSYCVFRGGSWSAVAGVSESSFWSSEYPYIKEYYLGFRLSSP